jgi:N-methylhydantoinase A/oxoprolinase/acetone carboxylase beta subunit
MTGIGIDTGGTYTDAVVYDTEKGKILSSGKALTTRGRLEEGIAAALDLLDQEKVKEAELLALSTTLATNACLEDKGSRAKLLMIGMSPETTANLEKVYGSYGFRDMEQLVFLDGKPENIFQEPEEPDWKMLRERQKELFGSCGAAGVVQIYPQADGGRLEKEARKILEEGLGIPVTTAYEMFDEVDVLKRGAGTLLNARLIPLIDEFLRAVKHVLKERGLHIPVAIVRSDGSLMSETLTRDYPVETLLSGPAASVVGGSVLAGEKDAVIVDMGGTTTDIALVRNGRPLPADRGISIGKWRTTVKGIYVETFLLGGDSAVRFRRGKLYLDGRRVIPLSLLARRHPEVTEKLKALAGQKRTHTRMLHEFYVCLKDISESSAYSAEEKALCGALREGPLMPEELAERLGGDIYTLHTDRLEEEGVVIRSGLTPTDMMTVKGDYQAYAPDAALAALEFLARNVRETTEEIPDRVYDLVRKRLYVGIAHILFRQQYPGEARTLESKSIRKMMEWSYEAAKRGEKPEWISLPLQSSLPVVGVGAPVHIFLPEVARLLGTQAVVRKSAPVANALGAIASQVETRISLRVKAEYAGAQLMGYSVFEGSRMHMFREYADAEQFAVGLAEKLVLEKTRRQGASAQPEVRITVQQITDEQGGSGLFFESIVRAVATDMFRG